MSMSYSTQFNLSKLKQSLFVKKERIGSAVTETVIDGAEKIMEKSKSNAPVDTHNLEEAHRLVYRDTRKGNAAVDIEVSGIGDGSEDPREVEEYLEWIHNDLSYQLGDKSLEKQAAGHDVGPLFLERAVEELKPEVIASIKKSVKDNL